MMNAKIKRKLRIVRKKRIRAKISGTSKRPRLSIFKSNHALYAQVIDDEKGRTLASKKEAEKNTEAAEKLGTSVAKALKEKNISQLVFDRSGYTYHGVIKKFADTLRSEGIQM